MSSDVEFAVGTCVDSCPTSTAAATVRDEDTRPHPEIVSEIFAHNKIIIQMMSYRQMHNPSAHK